MNNQLLERPSPDAARFTDTEVVLALYSALGDGDLDASRAGMHPDVVLHVPGTHPLSGSHLGPDAVIGFVLRSRSLTRDGEHIELHDVLAGDRYVGVYCSVRAERDGRAPLSNRTVHLVRVEAGRVAEIWLHNFDDLAVNEFWS